MGVIASNDWVLIEPAWKNPGMPDLRLETVRPEDGHLPGAIVLRASRSYHEEKDVSISVLLY
jgi:hypothetical protein